MVNHKKIYGKAFDYFNTIQGDIPLPRDDHTLSSLGDNRLIIFGGFVNGSRVNDIYQLNFVPNATTL